jgi:hypothetical protein
LPEHIFPYLKRIAFQPLLLQREAYLIGPIGRG